MNIKKLVLCIVITMVFSFGLGNIAVLADETQKNNEQNISELESSGGVDEIEEVLHNEEVEHIEEKSNIIEEAEEKKESKKASVEVKEVKTTKTSTKEKKVEESYTKSELRLLSALVYAEAGNQGYKGKLAVANVVLNRVNSKTFWHVNTIKEVIYDDKWGVQFSVIKNISKGSSPLTRALSLYDNLDEGKDAQVKQMEQSIKAAKAALNGDNNIGSYLYFSRTSKYLKNKYSDHTILEDHLFYNTK